MITKKNFRNTKGFTLVEVLIAVFIFAVVITVGIASMTVMVNTRSKSTNSKSLQEAGRLIVESISNEAKKPIAQGSNHFNIVTGSGSVVAESAGKATGGRLLITQTAVDGSSLTKLYQLQSSIAPYEIYDDGICASSKCKVVSRINGGDWGDMTSPDINVTKLQFEGIQWASDLTRHQFLTIILAAQSLKLDEGRKDQLTLRTTVITPKAYVAHLTPSNSGLRILGTARLYQNGRDRGDYNETSVGLWHKPGSFGRMMNDGFISWSGNNNGRSTQLNVGYSYHKDCETDPIVRDAYRDDQICLETMKNELLRQRTEVRVYDYRSGGLLGVAHLFKYNATTSSYEDQGKFIEASIGLTEPHKYYASWTTSNNGTTVTNEWSEFGNCSGSSTFQECLAQARQALVNQNYEIRIVDTSTNRVWGKLHLLERDSMDPKSILELKETSIGAYYDPGQVGRDRRDSIPPSIKFFYSWTRHDASNFKDEMVGGYNTLSFSYGFVDARFSLDRQNKKIKLIGSLPENYTYE